MEPASVSDDDDDLPAFSWPTDASLQPAIAPVPTERITPEWAWGGSTGEGIKVCIVDSGVDGDHPAVGGMLRGGAVMEQTDDGVTVEEGMHGDLFGHGTACAGIIHSIAPDAEIYSARVLGRNLKGYASTFVAGLDWALDNGIRVINVSMSTSKQDYAGILREVADEAYFKNRIIVAAANNTPVHSYPWFFSSVISVACHAEPDPFTFYYNPDPPVEFTAPGVDIKMAWANGKKTVGTGNSFAAPHIAGIIALILAKHPTLTPFQVKSVLYYTSKNVRSVLAAVEEEKRDE
jgi:subtilisin